MFNSVHRLKFICNTSGVKQSSLSQLSNTLRISNRMAHHTVDDNRRVLAIQSHVVHGYVGNKSATFPLQVLGFEVDAINSVHFSNHTGYKFIKGQVLSEKELADVFAGIEANELLDAYSHLLTGYIGKDTFLREVASIVKALRAKNPKLIYVCDPVLGDDGRLYVPAELLPIYQNEIIPLSDICTPNQFEAELLTGLKLKTESDAWQAMNWFHDKGVKTVVISSTKLTDETNLTAFVSHKSDTERLKISISIPLIGNGIIFTGTGDLFAALFLAHSYNTTDLTKALENTVATLQAVLKNTFNKIPEENRNPQKVTSRLRELKIVQSKSDIEYPSIQLYAKKEVEKF